MTDEQDFFQAMLEDSDPCVCKVFADWLEERGPSELASVMREASGAAVWKVGDQCFAGFEFHSNILEPRACPAFLELVGRMAAFAQRHDG